MYKGELLAIN